MNKLSADDLIYGYINGIFPMADSDGTLYWYSPDPRAVIPIQSYRPPKSLRPVLNKRVFEVRINTDFEGVVRACAGPRSDGENTWISDEIVDAYTDLHRMGFAYSVETYIDNRLAGGLYGVCIGSAFFGESMFYRIPDASKVAFHYLMEILKQQNFQLLDTQFINDNVRRFGAIEIDRSDYMRLLKSALEKKRIFTELALEHLFIHPSDNAPQNQTMRSGPSAR
jgi:leucyl/phenylalanyl-tRNA---protein transferase